MLERLRKCGVGLVAALLLGGPSLAVAQIVGEEITVGESCSYFGEPVDDRVYTFASVNEAEEAVEAIVQMAGLVPRFSTRAAGVPGAAAVIEGSERMLLYDPSFMSFVRNEVGSRWGPISILAHEIGHHLNGHTLEDGGSRPAIELEADYFSGFILQKMGASLAEAQLAMRLMGSEEASDTHPGKFDRLAAIGSGWSRACETDPNCHGVFAEDPPAGEGGESGDGGGETTTASLPDPNSCQYARDGECDEPQHCVLGTDDQDCRGFSVRPSDGQFDSVTVTNRCEGDEVKVAFMFQDAASQEWKTAYWFRIKFGEATPPIHTTNRYWYYYAESVVDGGTWNVSTDENARKATIRDKEYSMGRRDSGESWGTYNTNLTCN